MRAEFGDPGVTESVDDAYEWLVDIQRPDGSWWNYYLPDGSVDAVVAVVDSAGDSPALHAPVGLLARLAASTRSALPAMR